MSDDHTWDLLMGRFDQQDKMLEAIHAEAKKTNGRVTRLETVAKVLAWMLGAAVTIVAALIASGHFFH